MTIFFLDSVWSPFLVIFLPSQDIALIITDDCRCHAFILHSLLLIVAFNQSILSLRNLQTSVLDVYLARPRGMLGPAPHVHKVSRESQIRTDQQKPCQLFPDHEHREKDHEDDSEHDGEDVPLLQANSVHRRLFHNGVLPRHHAALLKDHPDERHAGGGPQEEEELLERVPPVRPRAVAHVLPRGFFLRLTLAPPGAAAAVVFGGAAQLRVVGVVAIELVVDVDGVLATSRVVIGGRGPGHAGVAGVVLDLDVVVQTDVAAVLVIAILVGEGHELEAALGVAPELGVVV
mmetsp:Transcript_22237/g.50991  ORF Transcript_22237/g.50991 Transcript_22237/m.50991 type:complete len:289 (-) Transcript_22237:506-1372(-)